LQKEPKKLLPKNEREIVEKDIYSSRKKIYQI